MTLSLLCFKAVGAPTHHVTPPSPSCPQRAPRTQTHGLVHSPGRCAFPCRSDSVLQAGTTCRRGTVQARKETKGQNKKGNHFMNELHCPKKPLFAHSGFYGVVSFPVKRDRPVIQPKIQHFKGHLHHGRVESTIELFEV